MKAVISVIGCDQVGILAKVSNECENANINVIEVTQTLLQDMFAMIMLVDIDHSKYELAEFAELMEEKGKNMGMVIHVMHQDIFHAMHRI
ncbi:MAG: ACT domain-containing protein [Erysipelotrichaceae bacterium]